MGRQVNRNRQEIFVSTLRIKFVLCFVFLHFNRAWNEFNEYDIVNGFSERARSVVVIATVVIVVFVVVVIWLKSLWQKYSFSMMQFIKMKSESIGRFYNRVHQTKCRLNSAVWMRFSDMCGWRPSTEQHMSSFAHFYRCDDILRLLLNNITPCTANQIDEMFANFINSACLCSMVSTVDDDDNDDDYSYSFVSITITFVYFDAKSCLLLRSHWIYQLCRHDANIFEEKNKVTMATVHRMPSAHTKHGQWNGMTSTSNRICAQKLKLK